MFLEASFAAFEESQPDATGWRDLSTASFYLFQSQFGAVKLRKRSDYPTTFATVKDNQLEVGYGNPRVIQRGDVDKIYSEEFLSIKIDCSQQTVDLQRDALCTLPLFFVYTPTRLSIANELDPACKPLPKGALQLNISRTLDFITGNTPRKPTSLFKNCILPSALEHLSWRPGSYQQERKNFVDPQPFDTYTGEPREFRPFIDHLLSAYNAAYGNGKRIACEFSGGIDSSIIAGHHAIHDKDPLLVTAGFPGDFGLSQQQKIQDFKDAFKTEHFVVPLDPKRHFPLSHMALNNSWRVFYEENESYYTTFSIIASQLHDKGIDTVYNGLGGDDSLARFDFTLPQYPLPSFFSKPIRESYEPTNHTHQDETFASQLDQFIDQKFNCNNTYISHDIWPVAPFTDPRFVLYVQSLAPRYRDNKNIFRIYCEAWQYPKSIFNPKVNETFGPYLRLAAKNFPSLADQWLAHSKLEASGLINLSDFKIYMDKAHTIRELLTVLRLIIVEINLQLLEIDITTQKTVN